MLDKAFEVWYPTLESELNELKEIDESPDSDVKIQNGTHSSEIIEEILELSRDNQKLLRSPDSRLVDSIDEVKNRLDLTLSRIDRNMDLDERRVSRKHTSMFVEDLIHSILPECQKQYGFLIALSIFQDDFPWIYCMGKELIDIIQSDVNIGVKHESISDFRRILDFTCEHPAMREIYSRRKENFMLLQNMQYLLTNMVRELELEIEYI